MMEQLQERDTWILLGIMAAFAILIYYGFHFALRLDSTLRLRHALPLHCREVGNLGLIFLFFGVVFLGLTITMVFGEFARHLDYKRHGAIPQSRQAARLCAGWASFAMAIGLAMIIFLQGQCR